MYYTWIQDLYTNISVKGPQEVLRRTASRIIPCRLHLSSQRHRLSVVPMADLDNVHGVADLFEEFLRDTFIR